MNKEKIFIANLKCSGCENTIIKSLLSLQGVESVLVDHNDDSVSVEFDDRIKKENLTNKLLSLGYPEATEENGLLLQLKSYASCLVGRINK